MRTMVAWLVSLAACGSSRNSGDSTSVPNQDAGGTATQPVGALMDTASTGGSRVSTPPPADRVRACPLGMRQIKAGEYLLRPQQRHALPSSLCMDEHEVTVSAYAPCVSAGACSAPMGDLGCNWGRNGRELHPINCVTLAQAEQFCRFSGKRLPTTEEWEVAARGRVDPPDSGATDVELSASLACVDRAPAQRSCPAAEVAEEGPFALRGLTGNVQEWTTSRACAKSPTCDGIYLVRGGSWTSYGVEPGISTQDMRRESEAGETVGFRCVHEL
jgi:formylglycine-generating enzyme required for sulfatase activity